MAEAEEPKKHLPESETPSDLPPAPAAASTSSEEKPAAVVEAPKEEYKENKSEDKPDESKALAIVESIISIILF